MIASGVRLTMRRLMPLLLLLAAACQPLPHPFADDVPPPGSPILRPRDADGIVVAPVAGLPAALATELAKAMAAGLRDAQIPASTEGGNRESYRLTGSASVRPLAGGGGAIDIDWELKAADGRPAGHVRAVGDASEGALERGDQTFAKILARQAAPAVAKLIQDEPPLMVGATEPRVTLRPVTGAPGDGGGALTRAMRDALRRAHMALAEKAGGLQDFILAGTVDVSPAAAGRQRVTVSWSLSRPDGREIGRVSQANAVPAGSLDGAWGDVAYAVANAAVPGVVALIDKAKNAGAGS